MYENSRQMISINMQKGHIIEICLNWYCDTGLKSGIWNRFKKGDRQLSVSQNSTLPVVANYVILKSVENWFEYCISFRIQDFAVRGIEAAEF